MSKKKFGFELVVEQALHSVSAIARANAAAFEHSPGVADTPIERLLYFALYLQTLYGDSPHYNSLWIVPPGKLDEMKGQDGFVDALLMEKQAQLGGWRADFVIHCYATRTVTDGPEGWRSLIVECDGHDFHERTKEQAAKDRSRDRRAILEFGQIMRFTGSELWRDPWGCAGQIMKWAEQGA